MENIAGMIRRARLSAGLSQKELADKLHLSNKTISAYERGKASPPMNTISAIAEHTKTSVSELLDLENPDENEIVARRLLKIEEKIEEQMASEKYGSKSGIFAGIVLLDEAHSIFLQEEDKYGINLGIWNLPSGTVRGDESFSEAAERIITKETGFKVIIDNLLGIYNCRNEDTKWIYAVLGARISGEVNNSHTGTWMAKDEFLKLPAARLVHEEIRKVYNLAITSQGLPIDTVKFIDYDSNQ